MEYVLALAIVVGVMAVVKFAWEIRVLRIAEEESFKREATATLSCLNGKTEVKKLVAKGITFEEAVARVVENQRDQERINKELASLDSKIAEKLNGWQDS